MNDQEATTLSALFIIIFAFILSSFGWFNIGAYFGAKQATNETTIECIETPETCKQRYEYLELREKLGEN